MPFNSSLHLITKLINFKQVKVSDYHFVTDNEILIEWENKESKSVCPHCQNITNDEAFWKTMEWIELAHKYFLKSCQTISGRSIINHIY